MDPNPPQDQIQDQPKPETTPKQQVVERVRQAANVLVTVKSDPSVDELAATIGLTLMLNKLGKHATAVFSGAVPSTLEFLKPEETLESNTDSLRDFIVSLDKSKADKLRYKVEENVVKIFITPYRASITQDDLEFTQGDFNVDVVLALGVTQREELDQAITAHGRILHDATVVTVTAGQDFSELGQVNWQEAGASSLSEMLVSISEAFQGGLIDSQIATAFLTGIVAETERFSNPKTSPKVMTMAAQLMAAGANQQLIANELEHAVEVDMSKPAGQPEPAVDRNPGDIAISDDGSLTIAHDEPATSEPQVEEEPSAELPEPAPELPSEPAPHPPSEQKLEPFLPPAPSPEEPESFNPLEPDSDALPAEPAPSLELSESELQAPPEPSLPSPSPVHHDQPSSEGQIHIDTEGNLLRKTVEPKHKVIQPLSSEPENVPVSEPPKNEELAKPAADGPREFKLPPPPELEMSPLEQIKDDTTLEEIEESVHSPHLAPTPTEGVDSARDAVNDAINQASFDPSGQARTDLNAMPLGMPPAPTPFDAYRLAAPSDEAPRPPVTDVTGNLPPEVLPPPSGDAAFPLPSQNGHDESNQIPPPPVPPPFSPKQ